MATPNFTAFRDDVRAWSNRDASALPDTVIEQSMSFAADDSYHRLMIPPLESTFTYDALVAGDVTTNPRQGLPSTELAVPSDLVSILHLRTTGREGTVFNEKTDVRTYHDMNADRYSEAYWTRQGANFLISGFIATGNVFELFYYKRLPALNAVYAVTQRNIDAGIVTYTATPTADQTADTDNINADTATLLTSLPVDPNADPVVRENIQGLYQRGVTTAQRADDTTVVNDLTTAGLWLPDEVPHWLKDQNRKILLFGALGYVGRYLQDDTMMQVNDQQYQTEIQAVNNEEKVRKASGGNTQMHYNGRGLI